MLTSSILSIIIIKLLSFDPKFQLNSETLVEFLNLIKYRLYHQVATWKYTMQYILLRLYFCKMFKVEHGNNMVTVSRPVQYFYTYSDTHSSNMNSELSSHLVSSALEKLVCQADSVTRASHCRCSSCLCGRFSRLQIVLLDQCQGSSHWEWWPGTCSQQLCYCERGVRKRETILCQQIFIVKH